MNAMTMASETIATLSVFRRRHASVHKPGETVCGISRGGAEVLRATSLGIGAPYFNWTRGSTALYIRSASRLVMIVANAT